MTGDESSAHRNIFLGADLSIVVGPALAGMLHSGHMACSITGIAILKRYLSKTVPARTKLRAGFLNLQQ